jgi:protein-tyrosine phosphatase
MTMKTPLEFCDIHCHLLPGIDDGPKDWNATIALARQAAAEGIQTIVATPHQLGRYEGNSRDQIMALTAEAQERIRAVGLPLTILPGADVRVQEDLARLVRENFVLTLADRHAHVLIELPHEQVLPLGKLIYQLQCDGVECVLSHPERNGQLQQNPDLLRPWVQQGCLVQVTAGSITGDFGPAARGLSRRLFLENMVHVVATDAHDPTHRRPLLRDAFIAVSRWVGEPQARKVFVENPQAVIRGETVDTPLPLVSAQWTVSAWWKRAFAS